MTEIATLTSVFNADISQYDAGVDQLTKRLVRFQIEAEDTAKTLERVSQSYAKSAKDVTGGGDPSQVYQAIAAQRNEIEKNALRERMALMEQEANAAYDLAEKKRANELSLRDGLHERMQEQKSREMELLNERMALMEQEAKAAYDLAEKKADAERKAKDDVVALNTKYFEMTHSAREVEISRLDAYYDKMRELHKDNADALIALDRNYEEQRKLLEARYERKVSESSSGDDAGFGGRQSKVLTRRAVSTGVNAVGGSAAGAIGTAASMAMMGPIGAAVGGFMIINDVMNTLRQSSRELKQEQREYNREVSDAAHMWEAFGRSSTTALGQHHASRVESLRAAAAGKRDRVEESLDSRSWVGGVIDSYYNLGGGMSDADRRRASLSARADRDEADMRRDQERARSESKISFSRRGKDIEFEMRELSLTGRPTQAKEDAKLSLAIEKDKEKVRRELADRRRLLDVAQEEENRALIRGQSATNATYESIAKARKEFNERKRQQDKEYAEEVERAESLANHKYRTWIRNDMQLREDRNKAESRAARDAAIHVRTRGYNQEKALMDARHRDELEDYTGVDKARIEQRQFWEKLALEQKYSDKVRQIKWETEDYRIQASTRGFDREMQLLESRYAREIALAEENGEDVQAIKDRQRAEREAKESDRDRDLEDKLLRMQMETDVTKNPANAQKWELEMLEKELRLLGATEEQLRRIREQWKLLQDAKANQPLIDQTRDMQSQLDVMRGHKYAFDDARERLKRDNPNATDANIDAHARMSETVRLEQQYGSPMNDWRRTRRDVREAQDLGIMSKERASMVLSNKASALMGRSGVGEVTEMSSRWQQIQSSLLKNDDPQRLTLEELKALRADIAAAIREGLTISGG